MRLPNWEARFSEFLKQRRTMPFAWGPNDCITFAADSVLATVGVDPIAHLRGQWDSALGAHKILRQYGGVAEAVESVLGPCMKNPAMIQRADVAVCVSESIEVMAVCFGELLIAPSKQGLFRIHPKTIRKAWAIGRLNG